MEKFGVSDKATKEGSCCKNGYATFLNPQRAEEPSFPCKMMMGVLQDRAGRMVTPMSCPFTIEQLRELQRQALIYKYMMASVPVPFDLLTSSSAAPFHPPYENMRLSMKGGDAEPGRCRRTDGKKWRCSREVAPHHKYCERHLHRGRPRSRKPVEPPAPALSQPYSRSKKIRHLGHALPASSPSLGTTASNNNRSNNNNNEKASIFESLTTSVSSYKEPRSLAWTIRGETMPMAPPTEQQRYIAGLETQQQNSKYPNFIDVWSMEDNSPVEHEMGLLQIGLALTGSGQDHGYCSVSDMSNWLAPATPGGPLAEILRPNAFTAASVSDRSSPCTPSGVLKRAIASLSDSSDNTSPPVASSNPKHGS